MFRFFDFTYYLTFIFYSNEKQQDVKNSDTAATVVGFMMSSNAICFLFLLSLLFDKNIGINKPTVVVISLLFQIVTYVRYIYKSKYSIEAIELKWNALSVEKRKKTSKLIAAYAAFSILSLIPLALFVHKMKGNL